MPQVAGSAERTALPQVAARSSRKWCQRHPSAQPEGWENAALPQVAAAMPQVAALPQVAAALPQVAGRELNHLGEGAGAGQQQAAAQEQSAAERQWHAWGAAVALVLQRPQVGPRARQR